MTTRSPANPCFWPSERKHGVRGTTFPVAASGSLSIAFGRSFFGNKAGSGPKWTEYYKKGDKLGDGNFAIVYKAKKAKANPATKSNIPDDVAVKVIDKAKVEDMQDVQREIEIMTTLDHPHIIKLFEVYDAPKEIQLVMELVTGGELFDRIVEQQQYSEKEAAKAFRQLLNALHHLHTHKDKDGNPEPIVHRDLKPENILYAAPGESPLKLADFGLARIVSETDIMKTACGTPGYVAPEVLKNTGYSGGAVDMWSAGVILYILLCGFPPFYEEELPALFDQILNARYDFPSPWWDEVSEDAKDLIGKLLELKTNQRLTAEQALEHKWLADARETELPGARKALKKYNASRKLKKVALGIIAQQRLERALKSLKVGDA